MLLRLLFRTVFVCALTFAGCGGDDDGPSGGTDAGSGSDGSTGSDDGGGGSDDGGGDTDGGDGADGGGVGDDAGSTPCMADAECDDGLFCNGDETCDATTGTCAAGTPPDVSDGIDCTDDSCDEDADAAVNAPNDTLCDSLDRSYCDAMGQAAMDDGVCNPASGCEASTTVVDPCTGGTCGPDPAGGGPVGTTQSCDDSSGTATCVSSMATPCTAAPSMCSGPPGGPPIHTTFAPACADATACDPSGTPATTTCPAPGPMCMGNDFVTSAATCDPRTGCGTMEASRINCSAMSSTTCRLGTIITRTCSCNAMSSTGCSCTSRTRSCDTCASRTTLRQCRGCSGSACGSCSIITCRTACVAMIGGGAACR